MEGREVCEMDMLTFIRSEQDPRMLQNRTINEGRQSQKMVTALTDDATLPLVDL